jgi:hypothetical protein
VTPVRVVVACARPFVPNENVIRRAADLAEAQGAHLYIFAAVRPLMALLPEIADASAQVLETTRGQLFATCVELLYDRPGLVWGVDVMVGHATRHLNDLSEHCDVRAIVHGGPPSNVRRGGLARSLFGGFASRLTAPTVRV